MQITRQLFDAFIRCRYKAHLIGKGETGHAPEYARLLDELDGDYRTKALAGLVQQYGADQVCHCPASLTDAIARGDRLILNASVTCGRFSVTFDALERLPDDTNPHI